jgi:hypothetical protein
VPAQSAEGLSRELAGHEDAGADGPGHGAG